MNLKLLLDRLARASFDIITHKNLRNPRKVRLRAVKKTSFLYILFEAFYVLSVIVLSFFLFSFVLIGATISDQSIADYLFVVFFAGFFFYYAPLGILYLIHSYWSNKLWIAGGGLDSEWKISVSEGAKRATLFQAIKDLQILRVEAADMERQGIDVGDLATMIEASDERLLAEAKKDLSIQEIAKLQEEFVSSLDKENVI